MSEMHSKLTPFEKIGGRKTLEKVAKNFYDKVYAHPWIGQYFKNISQNHIEQQQVDFTQNLLRGPNNFSGRMPKDAHVHMVISDELFDLRNNLLKESLEELKIPKELTDLWLKLDDSFRNVIVKDYKNAKKRFHLDDILYFEK